MSRTKRCRPPLQIEPLEIRRVLAQDLNFLGDLEPTPAFSSIGLSPHSITNVNGTAYFSGIYADTGFGLWKSDGTWGGTQLLEETVQPQNLVAIGSTLFFVGTHGGRLQLWKSDGTAAGTALASTVAPTLGSLTNVNGTLFFVGDNSSGNPALFKLEPGSSTAIFVSGASKAPTSLVNVDGTLFFSARKSSSTTQRGLWKSDGTAAGTVRVDVSETDFNPQNLTNFNGTLVFSAFGIEGRELWKSNGTTEGTVLLKNLNPGNPTPQNPGDPSSNPTAFTVAGDKLYFTAFHDQYGFELYVSDGTAAKTFRLKDILPGKGSSAPEQLTNVNGQAFFTAISETGRDLWTSDGTWSGTHLVKDFQVGLSSSSIVDLVNLNGKLMFAAGELWTSDGTEAGTTIVKEVTGPNSSPPSSLANVGGKLFFSADDGTHGRELWTSDGTAGGTKLVKDIPAGTRSSYPEGFTSVGATTYFTANFGFTPEWETPTGELWKSDGTAEGTVKFLDIVRGVVGIHGYPHVVHNGLTNLGGTLFFANGDALHGFELWKSNGTVEGTEMVKDIHPGSSGSFPIELTNVDGMLFFRARGPDGQAELWKSDGTESGTVMVIDLDNESHYLPGSYPGHLTNVGGTLYFQTNDGTRWKSDGTEAGTVQTEVSSSAVTVNDDIYYLAFHRDFTIALRKTNEQGVTKGLRAFYTASNLTNVAGTLYFAAKETEQETLSLWKTNGTWLGTVRVGPLNGNVADLINVGGQLFFTAVDDAAGRELWKSDGTPAGTVRVRDIMPGPLDSSLADFRNVGGILYFTATNGITGNELWRSNGTSAGTFAVKDLLPGAAGSHPEDLVASDSGALFFTAHTPAFGREPYALVPAANTAPVLEPKVYGMTDMEEDRPFVHVTFVRSLLGTGQTDADEMALQGIAIVDADVRFGRWQYRGPNDPAWLELGSPSEDNARLLAADQDTKLRFIPNLNFTGATHFTFRAWDRTEGVAGQLYTTTAHVGGSTAFSSNVASAEILVRDVNDAPVIVLGGTIGYVHDQPPITLAAAATVRDVDSLDFDGGRLQVRITDGTSTSNRLNIGLGFTIDAQNNVLQGTTIIGRRTSNGFATSPLTIVFNANATPAVVQQLVRSITFKTVGGAAGQRKVLFSISDGDEGMSEELAKLVNVT